MGKATPYLCQHCHASFMVRGGGGFFFEVLHCDRCGTSQSVSHEELGEIHLGFVKGLTTPYAVVRMEMDELIQAEYPGEPLTREQYHAASEASLTACACGGRFRYDAPARCPGCRSTSERWERDPKRRSITYD